MAKKSIEDILMESLDHPLTASEQLQLDQALAEDKTLRKQLDQFTKVREAMRRKRETSFGPFFGHRVVHKIQNLRMEIDHQIIFFFKKYQLAALGILVALIAINAIFAEDLTVQSIFGVEQTNSSSTTNETDSISFDFYKDLNEQL
jgi:hypothetical protein